jgi:hypothetical protein
MLWDLIQQHQLRGLDAEVGNARSAASDARDETRQLRRDVDRLTLACLAMWQIIQSQTNLTDEDLARMMHDLDAADGRVDGRMSTEAGRCPKCDRPALKGKPTCMYCGAAVASATPFH